jgi:acyl-CoA thioester hydrolase
MSKSTINWAYPEPFTAPWTISPDEIDHYNHVNNVVYLSRAEAVSWQHSNNLGLDFKQYKALDCAMVIQHHELDYLKAVHLGDTLLCATWITHCDNKIRLTREFQFVCQQTEQTVFTAKTNFVCVSLKTGKPKRMPAIFCDIYGSASLTAPPHRHKPIG